MAKTTTKQPKNKPANEIRLGALKVTIWLNTHGDKEWYSCSLTRSYRTEAGEWKETNQLNGRDVQAAEQMLGLARAWMAANPTRQPVAA